MNTRHLIYHTCTPYSILGAEFGGVYTENYVFLCLILVLRGRGGAERAAGRLLFDLEDGGQTRGPGGAPPEEGAHGRIGQGSDVVAQDAVKDPALAVREDKSDRVVLVIDL